MGRATKHLRKNIKKQKKIIRRKILPKNTTIPPTLAKTPNNITDPSSLRNMLLMRATLQPATFGNAYDKISSMQISKQRLLDQNKVQEEELEKYRKKLLKTKGKTEDVKSELDEAERKQKELALILKDKQNINREYAEINGDNNLARIMKEKLEAESALEDAKTENIHLTNQVKSQEIRNQIEKLENERKIIYAKNAAAQEYINSRENQNPEQALTNKFLELMKEQDKKKYYDKLLELQQENMNMQLAKAAVDGGNYNISPTEAHAIQNQVAENTKLQNEIEEKNEQKKHYEHRQKILSKLQDENYDLNIQKDKAEAQANYYNSSYFKNIDEQIASIQLAAAINEERQKQYKILKNAKEHEVKTNNEEYISEIIGLGDDQGTSLAKQLTSYEQGIENLRAEEKKAVEKYNEDSKTKQKLYDDIRDEEIKKKNVNNEDTFENYLAEVDPWKKFDTNDIRANSIQEYRTMLEGYKKWHTQTYTIEEEEDEGWPETENTNNSNDNWGMSSGNDNNSN